MEEEEVSVCSHPRMHRQASKSFYHACLAGHAPYSMTHMAVWACKMSYCGERSGRSFASGESVFHAMHFAGRFLDGYSTSELCEEEV